VFHVPAFEKFSSPKVVELASAMVRRVSLFPPLTMSNPSIIKTKLSTICLGSHRMYKGWGFELWLECGE